MSDFIGHECGIVMIRLRKPMSYYIEKYNSPTYGLSKLYLMLEKLKNRGQDGAGLVNVVVNQEPGKPYMFRHRSVSPNPTADIFEKIGQKFEKAASKSPKKYKKADWLQTHVPFSGELFMGHLRYGTHGKNQIGNCHPVMRRNNWRSRTLAVAGNFNMTNVDDLFDKLISLGQHPREKTDTTTVLEKIGHFLDMENLRINSKYEDSGLSDFEIARKTEEEIDIQRVLERSCKDFDGGYVMGGVTGYGAAFAARDPAGIRPGYYYADEEVIVVASEKPAIKTAFNVNYNLIKEILPGHALIIKPDGSLQELPFIDRLEKKSCSFERIYFSRGSDPEIYEERKQLGRLMCEQVIAETKGDFDRTVFSFIPNTAETAFLGMMQGMESRLIAERKRRIMQENPDEEEIEKILSMRPRVEKLVIKDAKMRTFITGDNAREDLVENAYDTTYEVIQKRKDTVVVIDDSIVRGTTLEKSIINMLEKLEPKKILILSSAPQIRYPDCYGIDMSRMKDFVAFRAVLALLKEHRKTYLLEEVYKKCKASLKAETSTIINHVKELYDPFTYEQVSEKISEIVKPAHVKAEVKIIYQTVDNLHKACSNHLGDWYFTGNYPTYGGNRIVNKAFVYFIEDRDERAY